MLAMKSCFSSAGLKRRGHIEARRVAFAGSVAGLVLLAGQAVAKIPAAFDRIPKSVVAVVATDNFDQTTKRIKGYAEKLKLDDMDEFDDFVEKVGETPGFKKEGSIALVVMPEGEKKAEDAEGEEHHDPMDRAVLLAQVSDYKAMVKELGGDPEAKVAKVDGIGDEPTFVRDIGGGWIVMGPAEEPVTSFTPAEKMLKAHEEALGTVGNKVAENADILVYANMEALRAHIEKGIDKAVKEAKKNGTKGNPMMAGFSPEAMNQIIQPMETVARAFARDAQACVQAITLGEKGLSFDLGAQFKAKSEIAGFFDSPGKADSTLASLPAMPFLFAASVDTSAPGTRKVFKNAGEIADKMIGVAKDEIKKQIEADPAKGKQLETALKMIDAQTQGIRQFGKNVDKLNGMDMIMGYSPALLAGAGLFSSVIMQQRTSDPAAFQAMAVDQLKAADNVAGPMKVESTFTPGSAEVGGVKLDGWTVKPKMDPNDPGASQIAMVNMFIFGATGQMSGFFATTKDALITTYSPNTQIMQQALDAAAGKNTLGAEKGVTTAVAGLPSGTMARGLIGTKSIFDLVQMGLSFTGQPIQLKVPADVPPIALGATANNGGTHFRFYAPIQVINTIGDVFQQFRDAQEQGDEGDEEPKDEKPRF